MIINNESTNSVLQDAAADNDPSASKTPLFNRILGSIAGGIAGIAIVTAFSSSFGKKNQMPAESWGCYNQRRVDENKAAEDAYDDKQQKEISQIEADLNKILTNKCSDLKNQQLEFQDKKYRNSRAKDDQRNADSDTHSKNEKYISTIINQDIKDSQEEIEKLKSEFYDASVELNHYINKTK